MNDCDDDDWQSFIIGIVDVIVILFVQVVHCFVVVVIEPIVIDAIPYFVKYYCQ